MNQNPEIPQWLKDTQNNSWNPELLISGLSLVFLYSISDKVSEFSIWLIQANGLNPVLVYFGSIYIAISVAGLQWTLTLHLILRGLWVAWLGLSYVYPQGIIFEKLPKYTQKEYVKMELGSTTQRVMLLERVCSSIFGLSFTIIGFSLFILIFFTLSLILDFVGVPFIINTVGTGVMFYLIWAIQPMNNLFSKLFKRDEIPFLTYLYKILSRFMGVLFFRESMMTYQTNMKKVSYHIGTILVFIVSLFPASPNVIRTIQFVEFATRPSIFDNPLKDREINTVSLFNNFYRDRNTESRRVQKAEILSYQIKEDVLEIFVPEFKWDSNVFEEMVADSVEHNLKDILTLKIKERKVESHWYRSTHPETRQRGWTSFVILDEIDNGVQKLAIDKWVWDYKDRKPIFEENYIVIPFMKTN